MAGDLCDTHLTERRTGSTLLYKRLLMNGFA